MENLFDYDKCIVETFKSNYVDNNHKINLNNETEKELLKSVAIIAYTKFNNPNYENIRTYEELEKEAEPYYDYLKEMYFDDNERLFDFNSYSVEFDHELDSEINNKIEEEIENIKNDNVDDVIDSLKIILKNKVKNAKKKVIHYISNWRPLYDAFNDKILTAPLELIELE